MAECTENLNTNENRKFKNDDDGDCAVNTVIGGGSLQLSGLNIALLITNMTVTTTAGKIPLSPLGDRNSMIIQNRGLSSIFIGNSDVTASGALEGWEIEASSFFSLDIRGGIEIYAICLAGTISVKVMELA